MQIEILDETFNCVKQGEQSIRMERNVLLSRDEASEGPDKIFVFLDWKGEIQERLQSSRHLIATSGVDVRRKV